MSNRCVILIYENPNVHVYTGNKTQRLELSPGRNEVDEATFLALTEGKPGSSALVAALESGVVRVFRPPAEKGSKKGAKTVTDDGAVNISAMTVKDAKDIIENTFDAAELNRFQADEAGERNRTGISDAIAKQLDDIERGSATKE